MQLTAFQGLDQDVRGAMNGLNTVMNGEIFACFGETAFPSIRIVSEG